MNAYLILESSLDILILNVSLKERIIVNIIGREIIDYKKNNFWKKYNRNLIEARTYK